MSLNHDVQNSPKENYMNGYISDFTDCIDFTKQYQKSCGFDEESSEALSDIQIPVKEKKENINGENNLNYNLDDKQEQNETDNINDKKYSLKLDAPVCPSDSSKNFPPNETEYQPIEPDVSITIGETNLDRSNNHIAPLASIKNNLDKFLSTEGNKNLKKKISKQKLVKKNHSKLPVNKNIKKKVALLKFKNGKFTKKKSDSLQFQGIQSNIKFKCYKCSYSDLSSFSELQSHQRKCTSGITDTQSVNETGPSHTNQPPSNFRITRKVYLCSACGSYYENWNLFLHMKEMHKRHICLYCLGMFSHPDKLSQHLQAKHNVIEQTFSHIDEFSKLYRGTCYLICVTCEAMFSEQEDFIEHSCVSHTEDLSSCPLCGLQGAHFPTCRRAFSDRFTEPEAQKSHPALGKKLSIKKKRVKTAKKAKEMFQIVSNDGSGEMSMIVRKQNLNDVSQSVNDSNNKENPSVMDNSVMSSIVNSSDDLTKHYNEKMLQLYKPNKSSEKVISSIQSIEDSINRVVENLRLTDNCEYEKEEEDESECYEADGEANSEDHRTVSQTLVKENVSSPVDQIPPSSEHGISNNFLPGEEKEIPESEEEQSISANNKQEEDLSNEMDFKSKPDVNPNLSECESTDSEKLTIAFDHPSEQCSEKVNEINAKGNSASKQEDNIPTASTDISYIFVSLKDEPVDLKSLIKEFVKVSCWNCVYCSHAKRIALNGKQLVLHILAEHRFVTVPESSSDEEKEKSALDIINRLKSNFSTLESVYFNTDTFDSEDKDFWKMNDRIYECFHCLFATYVHKELCSHNRKMHQKAMFLCIMCKSNFYTYSELLCHLCPGIYVSGQVINPDITYRCFLCDVEPLPSSFRLMVHLRRKHNSCDICFDQSSNQFQLSTHVWKHKLSHMCYRCGIAYRNKPDITKHLFWKHGTESVLCKKCLQKKWPHVYHFCVPPNSFVCDECSISLKSAVALKVHKRLHAGDYPHLCTKCDEKFISRKLLVKHLEKHEEKMEKVTETETEAEAGSLEIESENNNIHKLEVKSVDVETNCTEDAEREKPEKEKKSKKKKVINDVFDLPPVNLSESDDSDQEDSQAPKVFKSESPAEESSSIPNGYTNSGIQNNEPSPTQIVDGVWNNFQNYLVAKDMPKTFKPPSPFRKMTLSRIKEIMLSDHDYHIIPNSMPQEGNQPSTTEGEIPLEGHKNKKVGLDHDYCNNVQKGKANCKSKQKTKHKENGSKSSSSDSSSDSDSSCSCGSNCSCSSGSSSSSSSNDSDSDSREKRKQKKVVKDPKESNEGVAEIPADVDISVHDVSNENLIRESDLDTDETETDEDFYDYNPAREANRILAEKRTQLLANLNGSETVMSSSVVGSEKPATPKKKTKMKKKRSQLRSNVASKGNRKKGGTSGIALSKNRIQTFQAESGLAGDGNCNVSYDASSNQVYSRGPTENSTQSPGDLDTKRPKRKRVPLKFYGFSSDDEGEATPAVKKRDKNEANSTIPADTTPTTSSGFEVAGDATPTAWNPHSRSSLSWKIEKCDASTPKVNPIKIRTSQAGGKSTPTVENNVGAEYFPPKRPFQVNGNPVANKGEKLYCFCQCPYDEVSEMIACDAEDCFIEWFHFECVGIMVPPKGSWYCPDCRKKLAAENEFMCPPASERS